jgi:hypothetical protein
MPLQIEPPQPVNILLPQRYAVLRAAAARGALPPPLRMQMAMLGNRIDLFDEVIADIEDSGAAAAAMLARPLAHALTSRNMAGDAQRVIAVVDEAMAAAPSPTDLAALLIFRAKAIWRLGDVDGALAQYSTILRDLPANVDAFAQLAGHYRRSGEPDEVITLCHTLQAQGICHAALLSAQVEALAMTGDHKQMAALRALDQHLSIGTMVVPSGWPTLAAYNAQLAAELRNNPAARQHSAGKASVETLRISEPLGSDTPALHALASSIIATVAARVERMLPSDHLWLAAMPQRATMSMWGLVAGADGFERWHIHPHSWLSGTYYIDVPPTVVDGDDDTGCLVFGLPTQRVGDCVSARYPDHIVRPRPGLLATFPSYYHHWTRPHIRGGEDRICVAFDIAGAQSPD